jgi:hypothetical protein
VGPPCIFTMDHSINVDTGSSTSGLLGESERLADVGVGSKSQRAPRCKCTCAGTLEACSALVLIAGIVFICVAHATLWRPAASQQFPVPSFPPIQPQYTYPPPTSTFPSSPLFQVSVQLLNNSSPTPSFVYFNSLEGRASVAPEQTPG